MSIFDLHTSKARYELKLVLLSPLARKGKDELPNFLTFHSLISSQIKLAILILVKILWVGRESMLFVYSMCMYVYLHFYFKLEISYM